MVFVLTPETDIAALPSENEIVYEEQSGVPPSLQNLFFIIRKSASSAPASAIAKALLPSISPEPEVISRNPLAAMLVPIIKIRDEINKIESRAIIPALGAGLWLGLGI